MTDRGHISIIIQSGNTAALRVAVADHLSDYDRPAQTVILLEDVDYLPVKELIAADPAAIWYAVCDDRTEQPNTLHMYADEAHFVVDQLYGKFVIDVDALDGQWATNARAKWDRVRGIPTAARASTRTEKAGDAA
jgi:hypothetical protein